MCTVVLMVIIAVLSYLYHPGDFKFYLVIGLVTFSISPIVLFARHRLHAVVSTSLMLTFFIMITLGPLRELGWTGICAIDVPNGIALDPTAVDCPDLLPVGLTTFVLICILPLVLLSVAPAKAISRRLIFLALGLLLLIALNELSKLGLDVTAPKNQG